MSKHIDEVLSERTDISRCLVHLTRDCNGNTAKENLISILQDKEIKAYDHFCLFSRMLRSESQDIQSRFNVVCFTETPLDRIRLHTDIAGRQKDFKPYGLAFSQDDVRAKLGNPVFYVMEENEALLERLRSDYRRFITAAKTRETITRFPRLGALVNLVSDKHDFRWEREWRVRRRFRFLYSSITAVLAPAEDHEEIRNAISYENFRYVLFIDPKWNMEEMIEEISSYLWGLRK